MFRVRLRTLLLGVALLAAALGWLTSERRRIAERREELSELGTMRAMTPQPPWRLWVFGDDSPAYATQYFAHVKPERVRYLKHVRCLRQVKHLCVFYHDVADARLDFLDELPQIESLTLEGAPVTDAEMVHLKNLPELKSLFIDDTSVTDAGLASLRGLTKLRSLSMDKSRVTEVGVRNLQESLRGTRVICNSIVYRPLARAR
jgi:Leucine-rich repeat (LRR) protein